MSITIGWSEQANNDMRTAFSNIPRWPSWPDPVYGVWSTRVMQAAKQQIESGAAGWILNETSNPVTVQFSTAAQPSPGGRSQSTFVIGCKVGKTDTGNYSVRVVSFAVQSWGPST